MSRAITRRVARALAILLSGWILCLVAIVAWSMRDDTGSADAIIVMGAAQYSGRPSPVLRARLDHALDLWRDARATRIVLTGGRHVGDLISEAEAGRRYVVRRGVPTQQVLLEAFGRTSLASMHGAASLILTHRDSVTRRPRVLLVSDPFHMLRLDILARLHGLSPLLSPTRTSPISANRSVAIEYILRESIALPTDVAVLLWLHLTGHSAEPVADG